MCVCMNVWDEGIAKVERWGKKEGEGEGEGEGKEMLVCNARTLTGNVCCNQIQASSK